MKAYAYQVHWSDLSTTQHLLWSRRGDYFDEIIFTMLETKLKATFDPAVWQSVLGSVGQDYKVVLAQLAHQIDSVETRLLTLSNNFQYATIPALLENLNQQFAELSAEKERLTEKIQRVQKQQWDQQAIIDLATQVDSVLQK